MVIAYAERGIGSTVQGVGSEVVVLGIEGKESNAELDFG